MSSGWFFGVRVTHVCDALLGNLLRSWSGQVRHRPQSFDLRSVVVLLTDSLDTDRDLLIPALPLCARTRIQPRLETITGAES